MAYSTPQDPPLPLTAPSSPVILTSAVSCQSWNKARSLLSCTLELGIYALPGEHLSPGLYMADFFLLTGVWAQLSYHSFE